MQSTTRQLLRATRSPLTSSRRCLQTATLKPSLAFAFDIDGVLKKGEEVFPEAKRALKLLEDRRIPWITITNGGGVPDDTRRAALSRELGVEMDIRQMIQSHTPLRESLRQKYENEAILVIGGRGQSGRAVAESYGLKKAFIGTDIHRWNPAVWPFRDLSAEDLTHTVSADFSKLPIRAVLVVHDSRDWGLEIQIISELLQAEGGILGTRRNDLGVGKQELEVIFCNPDLLFGSDYPTSRYGAGAFKTALRAIHKEATGHDVQITQLGKPHKQTYDFAQSMLVEHLKHISSGKVTSVDKTFMVGDNPASDIAGANAAKWSSLLVRTGVYKDVQGPPAHQPSQIVDNVEDGVRWALEQEGLL